MTPYTTPRPGGFAPAAGADHRIIRSQPLASTLPATGAWPAETVASPTPVREPSVAASSTARPIPLGLLRAIIVVVALLCFLAIGIGIGTGVGIGDNRPPSADAGPSG